MAYEMLVGLQVTNDEMYHQYREAMMPILSDHGGGFGYDFKISEVLRSQTEALINRVFTIYFPDKDKMNNFFDHPDYKKAKAEFFAESVGATTIISQYER